MPRFLIYIFLLLMVSCKSHDVTDHQDIITVSISPFRYFVEALAGDDFSVNVMVPSEADPHIYEPVPGQVSALKMSKAYISDGYLGFELAWLKRFYGVNKTMKRLTLGDSIDLIKGGEHDNDSHVEGADPHFWISPRCAIRIAESVKSLLCDLKPENKEKYERNCVQLEDSIKSIDQKASQLLAGFKGKSFMIFHPSLAYLARDYDLNQIAVESEGKEPSVLSMKNLIDIAKARDIRTIFVQRGFDMRNAGSIASETGADLKVIDPMSPDWPGSVWQIITALHDSFLIKTDN